MAGFDLNGMFEGIQGAGFNAVTIFIPLFVLGIICIGLWWWWKESKKYDEYSAIIFIVDGFGNTTQKLDKGGIFTDTKTGNKRLFLKNAKVGLSTEKIPFVPSLYQPGKKVIYLLQVGLKNFRYVNHNFDLDDVEITVSEEDVNWAVNSYETVKKMFQPTLLRELLPLIALIIVSVFILAIFIYFFKGFGDLRLMAEAFDQASRNVAQWCGGQAPTVVP